MLYLRRVIFIFIGISFISCNNSTVDNIDRGAGYNFRPGYPELRVASTGYIAEDNSSHIIVSGDVVYGSLVFAQKDGKYNASVSVEIEIYEETDTNKKVDGIQFSQEITTKDPKIVNSQDVYSFEKDFDISPGNYVVQIVLTDHRSGKQSVRQAKTSIPDPEDETAHITEIRILARDVEEKTGFIPVTTFDIPSRYDTLQFIFQVTNNDPETPITLEFRLLKFESDTTAARPMHFSTPSPSSLAYKGIEYDDSEEVQTSTRELTQPGSVLIEFIFTDLERGNYRLEVESLNDEAAELYKAREFGIKSENYPSLQNARELAKPLVYLMDEKEYDNLLSIEDPDELKKAIDRFWLSNIKNSNAARQVIALYYQRVEEANKQFSNYKEGWKTDPGMVYILFGPPWYADSFGDQMTWSYSYNRDAPEKNFIFERPTLKNKFFPFDHYILMRSGYYYNLYYQQTERWRNGTILNTSL